MTDVGDGLRGRGDDVGIPDFRALFESAPGAYLVLAPDLTIVAVSDAYLRATMTERANTVGRKLFDVFPDNPGDVEATGVDNLRASLGRVLAERRADAMAVQKYDIRRPESEGGQFEERHWSPVNSPVFDGEGTLTHIIHRVEDVTAFVRLKEQGLAREQMTAELRARAGDMEAEILRRSQELHLANRELRALQSDLESRVDARTAELRRANEELERQIAERERTEAALHKSEAQLLHAQKMEAIGRLAGGVAHDFNNLLSVILSYCELLHDGVDAEIRADLEEIRKAGVRAAELTRQLLAFGRQQRLEPRVLDVNDVLKGVVRMLGRVLGADVELTTLASPGLWQVRADPGQLEQVLMNLVVNARDAMPRGGKLTLQTKNVELSEEYAREHPDARPGPHVMLAVSDTGEGMDRETQARIFEPFFTTKELGKGTGLGLSTVFGIVHQSGGHIWVYSEPGKGTTFRVYLPRTTQPAGEVPAEDGDRRAPESSRGAETILLVEDEEAVRAVARRILREGGYHLLEAAGAGDALIVCEQHAARIHLVLTDVVLPRMSGPELSARLRAMRPDLKVLLMSGYTDEAAVHHGMVDSDVPFLQKPITPEALLRKVREVLQHG